MTTRIVRMVEGDEGRDLRTFDPLKIEEPEVAATPMTYQQAHAELRAKYEQEFTRPPAPPPPSLERLAQRYRISATSARHLFNALASTMTAEQFRAALKADAELSRLYTIS